MQVLCYTSRINIFKSSLQICVRVKANATLHVWIWIFTLTSLGDVIGSDAAIARDPHVPFHDFVMRWNIQAGLGEKSGVFGVLELLNAAILSLKKIIPTHSKI